MNSPRSRSNSADRAHILPDLIIRDSIEILQSATIQEISNIYKDKHIIDTYLIPAIQNKLINKILATHRIIWRVVGNNWRILENDTELVAGDSNSWLSHDDEILSDWLKFKKKIIPYFIKKIILKDKHFIVICVGLEEIMYNCDMYLYNVSEETYANFEI